MVENSCTVTQRVGEMITIPKDYYDNCHISSNKMTGKF